MLIPSIDLKGGKVVQLIQGERLAIESDDVFGWVRKFEAYPKLQLIDLDAALGSGGNLDLVHQICEMRPCRVGGGIRTVERAREVLESGATHVIVGSSLFREGQVDTGFARSLADAIGSDRVIAAVDSKGGQVVIKGWRESVPLTAVEAIHVLEPYCSEFLYTHVDTEGLMTGIDIEAVLEVRRATKHPVTAAGGITTQTEIDRLDALGIDAVVGMAIYTGSLKISDFRSQISD